MDAQETPDIKIGENDIKMADKLDGIIHKCSSIKHEKAVAVNYCQKCRLYMCEACLEYHKQFYNHELLDLDKDKDKEEIFKVLCKEENHLNNLDYYCKNHNQLCCDSCIVKLKKMERDFIRIVIYILLRI